MDGSGLTCSQGSIILDVGDWFTGLDTSSSVSVLNQRVQGSSP
jgi:hypothetical protein